jgi:threonine synthase
LQHVFVPAGGGGLTLAIARGVASAAVAVHCVQPEGNNTIAGPLRAGIARATAVQCSTRISGLQVASVIDGNEVIAACRASGGTGHVVTDADVWAMQVRLAREEGIFCEPAGAVAAVGALAAIASGEVNSSACICCIVTGVGFKDAPSVDRMLEGVPSPIVELSDV